jgi:hypothetical protein
VKVIAGEQANGSALQQIKDKQYAAKYDVDGQPIFRMGIEFSQGLSGSGIKSKVASLQP